MFECKMLAMAVVLASPSAPALAQDSSTRQQTTHPATQTDQSSADSSSSNSRNSPRRSSPRRSSPTPRRRRNRTDKTWEAPRAWKRRFLFFAHVHGAALPLFRAYAKRA
ncbi:MAG TPA: hypothetical protein VG889_21450 [Rhizomicrobium sp.]|nr:hypothetical protein [Rhizomicrobium sp.]